MARSRYIDEEVLEHVEKVNTEEIKEEVESPTKPETNGVQKTKTGTVDNTAYVYVRKGPGSEHPHLEILKQGDKVVILGKEKDFYKVKTGANPIGYISSKFLREE